MLENSFDLYLESFSENYEIFTEGSIKDKAKALWLKIIELLKKAKEFFAKLFDTIIEKFKKAFSKDDVLMKKVDETIKAEKSGEYKNATSDNKALSSTSEPEFNDKKSENEKKPESQKLLTGRTPLYLTDGNMTVKWKKYTNAGRNFYDSIALKPSGSNSKDDIRYSLKSDDDGNLLSSQEEIIKAILNGYSSPTEAVQDTFWHDKEYKEYTVKSLGGLEGIREHYEYAKDSIPFFKNKKNANIRIYDDLIKQAEKDIKHYEKRANHNVGDLDKLGRPYTQEDLDDERYYYNRAKSKYMVYQAYRIVLEGATKEVLKCVEEVYKMSKAALIKCVGGASNFSESQINKIVLTAMYETDMCFA